MSPDISIKRKKPRANRASNVAQHSKTQFSGELALTSLIAWLGLVDDINTTLATNQLVVTVTGAKALQAVADLHSRILSKILCSFLLQHFHSPEFVPLPAPNP
jgi:hypothetical protein